MHSLNKEEYVNKVAKHIKFIFDRNEIKSELINHISDKSYYYTEQGMSESDAERKAIEEMGDADSVGKMLNKEHNVFIGWIFYITNLLLYTVGIFMVFMILFTGINAGCNYFEDLTKDIPKDDIRYHIKLDEKVQIDDRVIGFTDVIMDKSDNLYVYYYNYEKGLSGNGWSLGSIGEITDNNGNRYNMRSWFQSGGIISNGYVMYNNFSPDADKLIITYDNYNRYYKIEIPLKEDYINE